ncbi:hypothetical protein KDL01_12935 [Actinospica durhamensis]|uniref:Nephrocystin 3-like N-terminal domain-containing protein n=1 Tax=Actinospica durhamensis TaxID=1508375 RepID=A0A941ENH0_9ACTN|nr:hypothetical protein [Actinospica durhamensis]MBR7834173.1 hypothetical protein [Actinospica durhamensis]
MTIHHHEAAPGPVPGTVYSAYRLQVEQIAPPQLLDRDAELAELAGFCLEQARGPYVWWRAGPWAGKSALLSTFVLDPPAPVTAAGVVLVSFFVTARLTAQDTREAFTTALIEQLCARLGTDLPVSVDEGSREAVLLGLLADAATKCERAGGRLVLVVDGLDEDRGVTTGPGAHSIAGLLPGRPPAGMRVIIAGRANPPIPDDVPDWHPLRDPGVVRLLADSPHARSLERLGQSELTRLLKGTHIEQQLLGLLTAARGGLSGPDLRELTGADLVEVEEILHTVAGRAFTRRPSRWAPETAPQVYLLGHEELHHAACHYIGPSHLADYRDRIHAWAEDYRHPADGSAPWPAHTPEYLLTGYPRMLAAAKDTDRLTVLAIDPARHDRMLQVTGGDTAALAEVTACQDLLLERAQPDFYALGMLSRRRDRLQTRNAHIPVGLPAVWAALGHLVRAEELACAITGLDQQVRALTKVAKVMATAGERVQTLRLATHAEQLARAITDVDKQEWALVEVIDALIAAGELDRAEQLARSLGGWGWQATALAEMAMAMVARGEFADAERLADSIDDPARQARALAEMARPLAAAGEHVQARRLATRAEQLIGRIIVRPVIDPGGQASAWRWALGPTLAEVVKAMVAVGEHVQALRLVTGAEQFARAITDPVEQAWALATVATLMVAAGEYDRAEQLVHSDTRSWGARAWGLAGVAAEMVAAGEFARAEQLARTVTDRDERAQVLAAAAKAMVDAGEREQALRLANCAAQLAGTVGSGSSPRACTLARVAAALVAVGEHEHAEQLALTISGPHDMFWQLGDVAAAMVAAGEHDRAHRLATAITGPQHQAQALTDVASAMVAVGEHDHARQLAIRSEQLARTLANPYREAWALARAAVTMVAVGEYHSAEQLAGTIADPDSHPWELAAVAKAMVAAGELARAEKIVHTITDPDERAQVLAEVAKAMVVAGQHTQARLFATQAEQLARTLTDPDRQAQVLAEVVTAMVAAGDHDRARLLASRAEQLARGIADPDRQAGVLAAAARELVAAGDYDRAERLARAAALGRQSWVLAEVAEAMAAAGQLTRAEQLAHAVSDPDQRAMVLVKAAAAPAAGEFARAEQLARGIADPYDQAGALANVVMAMVAAGEHDRAEQLARTITDPDRQVRVLTEVAKAIAAAGEHDRACLLAAHAEHLADAFTDRNQRAVALDRVATTLVVAGEHDRAEQLARTITDPDRQAEVLVDVVTAMVAAGELARAEQLARTITDPDQQASALTEVAKRAGLPRAGNLLARAFALGWWLTPFPVLAWLYPHQAARIADAAYTEFEGNLEQTAEPV